MLEINSESLSEKIPLCPDAHGTIRVGNTRVTLSAVISCFQRGATPEAIVDRFNTLLLADVYFVIGYYLRHKDAVQAYLKKERQAGEAPQKEITAVLSRSSLREHILRRKRARQESSEA